ncbi:unnamed protein product [Prorocentrum cordatum]|uniref:Uncharacterized protein n=1 Tax=Prorocentrum cordatum TaxID=2364126 RepID=A0ABN9PYM1_9DINO|nr:unnamed protein product [Polarella glacialis]
MAPADGRAAESGSVEHGRGAGVLYCRLVVRGVVRATEAAVVDLGAEQTIVACPAACAPARSGGWAEPAEEPALGNHACPCAGEGGPCAVVFYCLDAAALLTAGIPEALRFRGADGAPAVPDADALRDLFRGPAEGDATWMCALLEQELFLRNSVVVILGFCRPGPCFGGRRRAQQVSRSI